MPANVELDHHEMLDLHKALLEAYRDRSSLQQMLYFRTGKNLSEIASDSANLTEAVFEVLMEARRDNWLAELVAGAHRHSPAQPSLRQFVATTFPDVLIDLDSDKELDGAGGAAEETSEQAVHGGVVFMREATIGDNAKIVGHDLTMNVTTTTPLLELPPSRQYEPTGDYQIDQVQQTLGDLGQLNLLGEQHGADDVPLEKLFPQLSQLFQRGAFEDHPCRQNEKSMKLLLYAATASELVLLETRPTIHVHGTKGDLEAYDELRREVRAMRKELAAVFGDAFSLADHIQKHGKRKESFVDALPDPVNPERCEAAEPHRDRAVELARKLFDTG